MERLTMTQDDIRKLDELYLNKCKEVNDLKEQLEEYKRKEYEREHRQIELM